ncbi:MAG: cupin domain-containing protein [Rhodobacteraceae bacterium CG17_big_fil_post_rev_8_21_14_2_50_65_11]|nr:MAG: cupin domain-containing protein [Rhodobacteraceae bacterium CG17_big_fil_post_rev_8_21_14_2_50_65_11]
MDATPGVTRSSDGLDGKRWNVVGHIYTPKLHSDNVMIWHAQIPADTMVPPHVHPTQDEWIYVLDGALEVDFGFESGTVTANKAGPGDTIRMPRGIAHGVYNRSGADATCVFGVAPARKLFDLFCALDGVTDPAELVRLAALHEVEFLPPPDAA